MLITQVLIFKFVLIKIKLVLKGQILYNSTLNT